MTPTPAPSPLWMTVLLMLLGIAGCVALWVLVSVYTGRPSSWMAVVAALDAALLLRLARVRPGPWRAAWAALVTGATIVASTWVVLAGLLGRMLGLAPWEAATRLGARHAWVLAETTLGPADFAWMAAGIALAALLSR